MPQPPETFTLADLLTWLEAASGCVVNFEDLTGVTLEVPLLRLPEKWHCHHGPYCEFAKLQGNQPRCSAAKVRSLKKAEKLRASFESVCPQGIWDWVCPVVFEDAVVGVWFLGSLRVSALRPLGGKTYNGPAIPAVTPERKAQLRDYGQLLCETVRLMLGHWVAAGHRLAKHKPSDFYRDAVLTFIRNRYHEDVRLSDLAAQLHVHPNYLGQMIRKRCGASFRDLLADLRIEKAKVLLRVGSHTVTEAAYACGFNDSNYFSTVFRKRTGTTPRAWAGKSRLAAQ
ncbi:MAG: hypothetical protein A3K19_11735 [Lentisphaerae bacterium RIFOXYB12_FULL_65_16]|nr:MAG: hypothetical protein A3K18_23205 [Lentisphaerae bacterium RIFOXYA12_64_32]OGV87984.1 MAG: hypothetical protein A3K19_11735 [Lentisphaerae bacterium RIFOXYB12_FULL_65_16]